MDHNFVIIQKPNTISEENVYVSCTICECTYCGSLYYEGNEIQNNEEFISILNKKNYIASCEEIMIKKILY